MNAKNNLYSKENDPERLRSEEGRTLRDWICDDCGHEVLASKQPANLRWNDGHVCRFVEVMS
jgi:hypothetical protein